MADTEQVRLLREIVAVLKRLEVLALEQSSEDGYASARCPGCGSTDLVDASVMGDERMVCGKCGAGMTKEAVHGGTSPSS